MERVWAAVAAGVAAAAGAGGGGCSGRQRRGSQLPRRGAWLLGSSANGAPVVAGPRGPPTAAPVTVRPPRRSHPP